MYIKSQFEVDTNTPAVPRFEGTGYGETAEIHRHHLVRKDQPIVVTVVDTPENLARLIPEVEEMIDTGMIATSDVEYIRVEKPAPGQS